MTQPPAPPRPTSFEARAFFIEDIAADTRILRLEATDTPDFKPGQYATIAAPGLEPRPFSIASAPHQPYLEFHVKNSGHGVSAYLFNSLRIGGTVQLEAPFGDHFWRPSARPLLAVAGGVGIAPLKAVIEAQLAHAPSTPTHLYWGVRDRTHLYLQSHFEALAAAHASFHYVPLLAASGGEGLRHGHAGPAIRADFASLAGVDIYMAGPAAMVEATLPLLLAAGAEKDLIFSDAFGGR